MGVHRRRAHPDEADRLRQAEQNVVKMRWSKEEMSLMALKEAELTRNGERHMNQLLATSFTNRSVEAIKKVRQKADYKTLVSQLLSARGGNGEGSNTVASAPALRSNAFLEHVKATVIQQADLHSKMLLAIAEVHSDNKELSLCKLADCLRMILPCREPKIRQQNRLAVRLSRRQVRRIDYARTQRNFRQHQGRCIKAIIDGSKVVPIPNKELMIPFWRAVMEQVEFTSPQSEELFSDLNDIWAPITTDEIIQHLPLISSSPGPDGVTPRDLRNTAPSALMIAYNLIMWCEKCPLQLLKAKTIFLPKKSETAEPGDFRPITIPPVCARHLHSIIATRINNKFNFDPRQRAFRPTNGCADNTTMLDMVLRYHNQHNETCHIASLDISKAFDSVSHNAIFGTLKSYGFPEGFVAYMEYVYGNSTTRLMGDDWVSSEIHPRRGVKQGDPLSPVLFNIIIDRLLKRLPDEVGVSLGGTNINAIAFADDVVLLASTPGGLQLLLDRTHEFLTACGMTTNRSKCFTISVEASGKKKHTFIGQRTFKIGDSNIPSLKRSEEWCYLGINFTADGKSKIFPHRLLEPKLENLRKAPLKPQQRLHALRTVLIPQLYHRLTLGNVMIGSLNTTDAIIRGAVRNWLNLPKDVPNAFFHAPISDGGLGIPAVRWIAPWLRLHCLESLELPNQQASLTANTFMANEIDKAKRRLQVEGRYLVTRSDIDAFWSSKLHESVDGSGLKEASHAPYAHRWIREPTRLLSGRDFIRCLKLRINALPSKSRTTRGRARLDRLCRGGCGVSETTNHILQGCHRTHSSRVERHDSVVKFIKRSLDEQGAVTHLEPRLSTSIGIRKPDLITIIDNVAIVVDAQVVTDGWNLTDAHNTKVSKYNTDEINASLKRGSMYPESWSPPLLSTGEVYGPSNPSVNLQA